MTLLGWISCSLVSKPCGLFYKPDPPVWSNWKTTKNGGSTSHPLSGYDIVMDRKLSDEEKAKNIAAGLTPTGRIKTTRGVTNLPKYEPGDYRCRGTNFTDKRKNDYLDVIRKTGEPAMARAEIGVNAGTVQTHCSKYPEFRQALDEAHRQHASIYANEMRRRGLEGWDEPVFGSQGPGAGTGIVGYVRKFSDRLLIEQAKKHDKKYHHTQRVEQHTTIEQAPSLDLDKLSPESRKDLRRILERERKLNGGESEQTPG